MSDPIEERLTAFDPGVPVSPLSPADIRRRGDKLRRRNTVLTAAAAAAVIAVVATPIAVLAGGSDDHTLPANPGPTSVAPTQEGTASPALPVPRDALLTPADLPDASHDGTTYADWNYAGSQYFSVIGCHDGSLPDFGATDQAQANYAANVDDPNVRPTDPPTSRAADAVFDFGDAAAASKAFDQVKGWLDQCTDVGEGRKLFGSGEVPGEVDSSVPGATGYAGSYLIADDDLCDWQDGCDTFFREFQAVGLVDNRVVLFSWVQTSGNGTDDQATYQRGLSTFGAAMARAAGLDDAPSAPETGTAGDGGATELSYADLGRGLAQAGDDSDVTVDGPSAGASGVVFPDNWCAPAPDADASERLAIRVSGPEYGNARLAVHLPTAQDATDRIAAFEDAVATCPRPELPDPQTPIEFHQYDLGPDAPEGATAFGYTLREQGLAGSLYAAATVGPYLVMVEYDGEYSADSMEQSLPDIRKDLVKVLGIVSDTVCGEAQSC